MVRVAATSVERDETVAERPEEPAVVGLGEALWDVFKDARRPGGAPANVAWHAGQMGCRGVLASRVGKDDDGDEYVKFVADQSLETAYIQRDESRPTGRAEVEVDSAGQPKYNIVEGVAYDAIELVPELERLMSKEVSAVCFGTLAQRNSKSRDTIHKCLELASTSRPACLRVYDVNLRQKYFSKDVVSGSLTRANTVKLNSDEVVVINDLLDVGVEAPERNHLAFARALLDKFNSLQLVVVTRGKDGCMVVSHKDYAEEKAKPVKVADAVGAGDAFTAALITASKDGAQPVLRDEFKALQAKYADGVTMQREHNKQQVEA
eukprot:jgi/Chlat1/7574/Chrsp63S07063